MQIQILKIVNNAIEIFKNSKITNNTSELEKLIDNVEFKLGEIVFGEEVAQLFLVPQNDLRRTVEHYIVEAADEAAGIGLVGHTALALGEAVAKLEAGALVGDPAVKEEQDGVAPIHVGAVQLEKILALGHTFDHFRKIGHTAAVPLGQEGLVTALL